jgi:hypothetical protein
MAYRHNRKDRYATVEESWTLRIKAGGKITKSYVVPPEEVDRVILLIGAGIEAGLFPGFEDVLNTPGVHLTLIPPMN